MGENYIFFIFEMLINFCWNFVVLIVDIEKVFFMVGIKLEDRNMLCFFWLKDFFVDKLEIVEYRFNCFVFGLRLLFFILGEIIVYYLNFFK